jgi:hypothetical protein
MDYQNGKIYKITNCIDNEVYIGSTCSPLTKRWHQHKNRINSESYKNTKFYKYIIDLGFDKFSISLVENYPCTNKTELRRREGELIREQGTLNTQIEGRTRQEYYENNKEKFIEYYQENKEYYQEQKKEYRENNKEKIAIRKKEYYEMNKEKLSKKIECNICKSVVTYSDLTRHKKSKKCLAVSVGNKTDDSKSQA